MNTEEEVAHLILRVARLLPPQIQDRVNAAFTKLQTDQGELETKRGEFERMVRSTEDSIQPDKQVNGLDHPPEVQELMEKCEAAMRDVNVAMSDGARIMRLIGSATALARPVIQQQGSNEELAVPVADLPEIVATFASLVAAWESLTVGRRERATSDETQSHNN